MAKETTMQPEDAPPDLRLTPRLVIGLAVMSAGLVLALDSLGVVDGGQVFRYWPLVLIAVGIVKWLGPPRCAQAGFVWIAAGGAFLFVTMGRMPFGRLWALLLFFVGANIAWRALRPQVPAQRGVDPANRVDMLAVLGGAKTVSYARDFRGGNATATLGGCEIDLRRASIAEGETAVLDTFAFWGGIEIKVPEDWQVLDRGNAFMGGFVNSTRPAPGASKRLVVTGLAIMGGVEVKN
jgi:predicted membrane protein